MVEKDNSPQRSGKDRRKQAIVSIATHEWRIYCKRGFTVRINENILWDIRYIIYDTNGFGRDVRGLYRPKNSNSGTPAIVNGLVEDKIAPKTMDIVVDFWGFHKRIEVHKPLMCLAIA